MGKRGDGYHLLESLVVFAADVGDTITARPSGAPLTIDGPFASALSATANDDNLVTRAVAALGPEARTQRGLSLAVTKQIPVAAGLGGGSADAAATLRLLNRLRALNVAWDRLAAIGAALGADVPMCVLSRPLIARGVGEAMTPVAGFPALPMVLACPPVAVRTADVFRALRDPRQAALPELPALATVQDVASWLAGTRNDLAEPAAAVSPLAGAGARELARDPDCLFARMTGSGPSSYGLFPTQAAAKAAAARLAAVERTWWVRAAVTGGS